MAGRIGRIGSGVSSRIAARSVLIGQPIIWICCPAQRIAGWKRPSNDRLRFQGAVSSNDAIGAGRSEIRLANWRQAAARSYALDATRWRTRVISVIAVSQ